MQVGSRRAVAVWLSATLAMVFAMVLVGGATRLTGSGLSMVDWGPLGRLPPMEQGDWDDLYARYQESPQFLQVNAWMTLGDFKKIFWWEYVHRQLGRLIGLVYGIPWLVFLLRGRLRGRLLVISSVALALGALQGGVGWWMVRSGLVDRPEVSHYRLATHLSLALLVGMCLLWMLLDLRPGSGTKTRRLRGTGTLMLLTAVQVLYGAFMAGKKAGWGYDTWPDMDGDFLPAGAFAAGNAWHEDGTTIHFIHRTLAWVLLVGVVVWFRAAVRLRPGVAWAVLAALVMQFVLGVLTVVHSVPVVLGVGHQAGACALLAALTVALHPGSEELTT